MQNENIDVRMKNTEANDIICRLSKIKKYVWFCILIIYTYQFITFHGNYIHIYTLYIYIYIYIYIMRVTVMVIFLGNVIIKIYSAQCILSWHEWEFMFELWNYYLFMSWFIPDTVQTWAVSASVYILRTQIKRV